MINIAGIDRKPFLIISLIFFLQVNFHIKFTKTINIFCSSCLHRLDSKFSMSTNGKMILGLLD